jgi:protein O-GlcNAc transferase
MLKDGSMLKDFYTPKTDCNADRFLPAQPRGDFLQLLNQADVVLDPLHFGGGHTSYECLALGMPVVTWPGQFLRSRITLALCRKMGVLDTVVDSADEYIRQATSIAADKSRRETLRQRILEQNSILYEDLAEVRAFEECLRSIV